jgi:NitT/TauT family transport system ATP-binding protein
MQEFPETQNAVTVIGKPPEQAQPTEQTPSPPYILELRNVTKRFNDTRTRECLEALKDFDFIIEHEEKGEFVVLLGPSGCGKSTILNLISGLSLPDEGEVLVFGERVTGPNPKSATVPQAYTCFPWLTVLENVEFGLAIRGKSKQERREIAMEYLAKVGLEDRRNAYPKQLSGGMQQRVAIARTLAMKLPLVLMDEPFGALDAQTRTEMQQMVLQLWEEEKNTIIFVTHDITEALLLGDRVVVFSPRPARIKHQEKDLDQKFGPKRPPSLVQDQRFVELCAELREQLKKAPADGQEQGIAMSVEESVTQMPRPSR